jgi:hypothetical protein
MRRTRALPDDFDSLQALRSIYGARQGLGVPLHSPGSFSTSYREPNATQSLQSDTAPQQVSLRPRLESVWLSPSHRNTAFTQMPTAPRSSFDALSPLSINSSDRYHGSILSSLYRGDSRSRSASNGQLYHNDYSLSTSSSGLRPLQPQQLRETRPRNNALFSSSPPRMSTPWNADVPGYAHLLGGLTSPAFAETQYSLHSSSQPVKTHIRDTGEIYSSRLRALSNFRGLIVSDHDNHQSSRVSYPTSNINQQQSSVGTYSSSTPMNTSSAGLYRQDQYKNQNMEQCTAPASRQRLDTNQITSSSGSLLAAMNGSLQPQITRVPTQSSIKDYEQAQPNTLMASPQVFTNIYGHLVSPIRPAQALDVAQLPYQSINNNLEGRLPDVGVLASNDVRSGMWAKRKRTISMPTAFKD